MKEFLKRSERTGIDLAKKPYRLAREGIGEGLTIIDRIRKRDFSGYTGMAIKNSTYQFGTSVVAKIGSLLFTIIIARMLMPELFGLYSLTLSTLVLFTTFSDLGVGQTMINFISKELIKKNNNAKGYYDYLVRLRLILSLVVSVLLLITAYFVANYYYHKPIFLALLAGSLYVLFMGLSGFFSNLLQADNNFKPSLYKEIIFQIIRLVIVPLSILLMTGYSSEWALFSVFLSISLCYLVALIYLYYNRPAFTKVEGKTLGLEKKKEINSFVVILTTMGLSGVFFGYVDSIILGRFVESQFIGFYQAALSLIGSAGALLGFSGVLFPIFNRLSGKRLKKGLSKSIIITLSLSILLLVFTIIFSKLIIILVYGQEYILSTSILRILAFLFLIDPLIAVYMTYHISQGNQKKIAIYVIMATILNVILTLLFVAVIFRESDYLSTVGASISAVVSRGAYLMLLKNMK